MPNPTNTNSQPASSNYGAGDVQNTSQPIQPILGNSSTYMTAAPSTPAPPPTYMLADGVSTYDPDWAAKWNVLSPQQKVIMGYVMEELKVEGKAGLLTFLKNGNPQIAFVDVDLLEGKGQINTGIEGQNTSKQGNISGVNAGVGASYSGKLFGMEYGVLVIKKDGSAWEGTGGIDIGVVKAAVGAGIGKKGFQPPSINLEVDLGSAKLGGKRYAAPNFTTTDEGKLQVSQKEYGLSIEVGVGWGVNSSDMKLKKGLFGGFGLEYSHEDKTKGVIYIDNIDDYEKLKQIATPEYSIQPIDYGQGSIAPLPNIPSIQSKLTPPSPANVYVPRQCLEPNAPSPSASNKQLAEELIAEIKTYKPRLSN